jgi:hypothetical protein
MATPMPQSTPSAGLRALAIVLAISAAGCQDTIVKVLGPDNAPQLTVQPDLFRFYANDMDNVHDQVAAFFSFSGTSAMVIHQNFVHHGSGTIAVLDAVGDTVYKSGLEWESEFPTREGVPGRWKAIVSLYGARGRVDVSVTKPAAP